MSILLHKKDLAELNLFVKHQIKKCDNIDKLEKLIEYCSSSETKKYRQLRLAIDEFIEFINDGQLPKIKVWDEIIPAIVDWATTFEQAKKIQIRDSIELKKNEIRSILANMFLCNISEGSGRLVNLYRLYTSYDPVAIERIKCMLGYFYCEYHNNDDHRIITFERRLSREKIYWESLDNRIDVDKIKIHKKRIEDVEGVSGIVDFANKDIHIHSIIPSATQEEVLFSCHPEAFVSIIISPRMNDNEAIVIKNVKRYIEYTGYQDSFKFNSINQIEMVKPYDIIAIDATPRNDRDYYKNPFRDLEKCYIGFEGFDRVSTGAWGCGVFGGDHHLKFIEQVIVASLHDIELHYSFYENSRSFKECKRMLNKIKSSNWNVSNLIWLVYNYDKHRKFYKMFME
jgi:poly(ADP-ribose) glycohydrolase